MQNPWVSKIILLLFFLFPVLMATVRDAGSVFYALLGLLGFYYCRKGRGLLSLREKRVLLGFAVFFVLACLSLFMTEDLSVGIPRFERYGRLLLFLPVYYMLRGKPLKTGQAFLGGAFVALFVMLGQALYQVEILGQPYAHGAYHKIIMGDMAIFFTTLVFIGGLFYGKNRLHYVLTTLALGVGLYVSLLTVTRAAWLFVPLIVVSLLWLYRKRLSRKNFGIIMAGIVASCLFIAILQPKTLIGGLEQGWSDLKTFSLTSSYNSWGLRLILWNNSLLIFKESPLLGTGTGDFKHDSKILIETGLSPENYFAASQTNAHSIYFMVLAEGGIVGLISLITALFILPFQFLYRLWKHSSDQSLHFYALLGLISIIAFAWFGISESWINRNPMVNAYCMAMLAFMSSAANRAKDIQLSLSD